MTKQEQIEEMAVIGCVRNPQAHTAEECAKCDFKQGQCNAYRHAEALYNEGYRKIDEFEKCRKCPAWSGTDCTRNPYTEGCLDDKVNLKNEIKRLEKENEQLKAKLKARLTCDFVKTAQTHAVQDFADKVKEEVYPFLQAEMYNKKHFITGDLISDKLLENQNIGILKAQDVLSKWFKVKIDELLKEYE